MDSNIERWRQFLTGGDGTPDDEATVQARIDTFVSSMGTYHTDDSTLPVVEGSYREGRFYDPLDLLDYLAEGGLIADIDTGQGMTWVHIIKRLDALNHVYYEVWIQDAS